MRDPFLSHIPTVQALIRLGSPQNIYVLRFEQHSIKPWLDNLELSLTKPSIKCSKENGLVRDTVFI